MSENADSGTPVSERDPDETRRLVREYKKAIVLAAQTDLLKKLRRMWRLA